MYDDRTTQMRRDSQRETRKMHPSSVPEGIWQGPWEQPPRRASTKLSFRNEALAQGGKNVS